MRTVSMRMPVGEKCSRGGSAAGLVEPPRQAIRKRIVDAILELLRSEPREGELITGGNRP